ncbi:hypothetical protein GCM10025734_38680 [Kitasatospora paranensis]
MASKASGVGITPASESSFAWTISMKRMTAVSSFWPAVCGPAPVPPAPVDASNGAAPDRHGRRTFFRRTPATYRSVGSTAFTSRS